ncbi:MAG: hypothetical protein AB7J28_12785 [Hyphomonadaceae bacterium]
MRWLAAIALFNFKPNFTPIEKTLRNVIVHRAIQKAKRQRGGERCFHAAAPSGLRFSKHKRSLFDLAAGNAIRRTRHRNPVARIRALRELIDDIERWIERTVTRLERGLMRRHLVMARTPVAARWTSAMAQTPALCDTS